MSTLIDTAARIAALAHKEQTRKQDDTPYITHPFAVALKLAQHGFSDEVIAAAIIHDVLEDTEYPEDELRAAMGTDVMAIVDAVTNDDTLSWEEKKLKYIETVRTGNDGAKAVATADKVHNLETLIQSLNVVGPSIWDAFKRGKEKKIWFEDAMLAMLKESWDHPLVAEYEERLEELKTLA